MDSKDINKLVAYAQGNEIEITRHGLDRLPSDKELKKTADKFGVRVKRMDWGSYFSVSFEEQYSELLTLFTEHNSNKMTVPPTTVLNYNGELNDEPKIDELEGSELTISVEEWERLCDITKNDSSNIRDDIHGWMLDVSIRNIKDAKKGA